MRLYDNAAHDFFYFTDWDLLIIIKKTKSYKNKIHKSFSNNIFSRSKLFLIILSSLIPNCFLIFRFLGSILSINENYSDINGAVLS